MNADPMLGRAGYEWGTRSVATQQSWVLLWKNDLDVFFCENSIAHSTGLVSLYSSLYPVERLETQARVGLGTYRGSRLLYIHTHTHTHTVHAHLGPWVPGPWSPDPGFSGPLYIVSRSEHLVYALHTGRALSHPQLP